MTMTTTRRPITDRACLRHHHERLGRMLDCQPWTAQQASEAQRELLAQAQALRDRADGLDPQSAYGPAVRIRDDRARSDHARSQAIAAQDIRRHQDDLRREARDIEMRAGSIPQERHDSAYVTWMLDHMASVAGYAHLCAHHDDYAGMAAVADRIRSAVVRLPEEARLAARDLLDETATAAGVPQWRKTYYIQSLI